MTTDQGTVAIPKKEYHDLLELKKVVSQLFAPIAGDRYYTMPTHIALCRVMPHLDEGMQENIAQIQWGFLLLEMEYFHRFK